MRPRAPWLWIALFAGLFVTQVWILPMVIQTVTGADWFKGTQEEGGDSLPVSNPTTTAAFSHCNHHLAGLFPEQHFQFADAPEQTWDIGFGRYVVAASVRVGVAATAERQRRYLCRLHYRGGDEADASNWEVAGLEFTTP